MIMKTKNSRFRIDGKFFLIIVSIILAGCTASKLDLSLNFKIPDSGTTKPNLATVGIDDFLDFRPQAIASDAGKWIGFIPGVLWLDFETELPDTYTVFSDYKSEPFSRAIAKVVYSYIDKEGVFEKTLFIPWDKYSKIDYRIEGILNRSTLKETGYYYGSSLYSWLTRVIGLPYVSYEFSLNIDLRLRRIETGEIIWTYNLKGQKIDKYYNVYQLAKGREGKDIISYNFSEILKEQLPEALESLKKAWQ